MDYYINPIWFYLADFSESVKVICIVFGFFGLLITCLMWGFALDDYCLKEEIEKKKKFFKKIVIITSILTLIGMILPSSEACNKMIIASCLTKENVSEAKTETYEFIDHILDRLDKKDDKK